MTLTLINRSGQAVPRRFLTVWVRRLAKLIAAEVKGQSFSGRELVVVFVDRNEALALNKKYRKKNYATDVLSFSSDEPGVVGELVICPKVISRQAKEHGLLVREELGYMVLHGFLHLLGFDHEKSKSQAKKMFALQDRLFDRLLSRC